MALGSHLITVRRLKKYIDDVIGKKANLPDKRKTIIGNIAQINTDLSDIGKPVLLGYVSNVYGTSDIDLSDSITNYKMLLIVGQQVTSTYYSSTAYIPVTHFKTNCANASHILYTAPATGGAGVYYSTDTKLIAQRHDSQNVNVWVYGIK